MCKYYTRFKSRTKPETSKILCENSLMVKPCIPVQIRFFTQ
nr:MAG TPA: hypothetical protein [Caudoviricetes sp.]